MKTRRTAFILLLVMLIFAAWGASADTAGSYRPAAKDFWAVNLHEYWLFDERISPAEAAEYCESIGGYLVTISSRDENQFLQHIFEAGKRSAYTIGATDAGTEGDWRWMNGEAWIYSNWYPGGNHGGAEPNNGGSNEPGGEDYCVAERSRDWQWVDIFGSQYDYSEICGFMCDVNRVLVDDSFVMGANGVLSMYIGSSEEVVVPEETASILDDAFSGCNAESIHLPDSISFVGENAFTNCQARVYCSLGSETAYAMSRAGYSFWVGNDPSFALRYLTPDDGEELALCGAWLDPHGTTMIQVPDYVTRLGDGETDSSPFSGLEGSLTAVELSDGVAELPAKLFRGFRALQEIVLPEGITALEDETIADCPSLTRVVLPRTLTAIGSNFRACPNVVLAVTAESPSEQWAIQQSVPYQYYGGSTLLVLPDEAVLSEYDGLTLVLSDGSQHITQHMNVAAYYSFSNLSELESYSLWIENEYGQLLTQPVSVSLSGFRTELTLPVPRATANIRLNVRGEGMANLNSSAEIRWFDAQGRELAQGPELARILPGTELTAEVRLFGRPALLYLQPEPLHLTVDRQTDVIGLYLKKPAAAADASLTLSGSYCPVGQTAEPFSAWDILEFSVENLTGGVQDLAWIVEENSLLLGCQAQEGDEVRVTVSSPEGDFLPVSLTAVVGGEALHFTLVQRGILTAVFEAGEEQSAALLVFNSEGILVWHGADAGGSVSSCGMADGAYTLVLMEEEACVTVPQQFSQLLLMGLTENTDYLIRTAAVTEGNETSVSFGALPGAKHSLNYFSSLSFTCNNKKPTVGRYFTLRASATLREAFAGRVSDAVWTIELPENCSYASNTLSLNSNSVSDAKLEARRLTVPAADIGDTLRVCLVPLSGGSLTINGSLSFRLDGEPIVIPMQQVTLSAEGMSIKAPKVSNSVTVPVSGQIAGSARVRVYDNGSLVGETETDSVGFWNTAVELVNPSALSYHRLEAVLETSYGELRSEEAVVEYRYSEELIRVNSVTMRNQTFGSMVLLMANSRLGESTAAMDITPYSFNPAYSSFEFEVQFEGERLDKLTSVFVILSLSNGSSVSLTAEPGDDNSIWFCTGDFNSSALPTAVSVSFSYDEEVYISEEEMQEIATAFDSEDEEEEDEGFIAEPLEYLPFIDQDDPCPDFSDIDQIIAYLDQYFPDDTPITRAGTRSGSESVSGAALEASGTRGDGDPGSEVIVTEDGSFTVYELQMMIDAYIPPECDISDDTERTEEINDLIDRFNKIVEDTTQTQASAEDTANRISSKITDGNGKVYFPGKAEYAITVFQPQQGSKAVFPDSFNFTKGKTYLPVSSVVSLDTSAAGQYELRPADSQCYITMPSQPVMKSGSLSEASIGSTFVYASELQTLGKQAYTHSTTLGALAEAGGSYVEVIVPKLKQETKVLEKEFKSANVACDKAFRAIKRVFRPYLEKCYNTPAWRGAWDMQRLKTALTNFDTLYKRAARISERLTAIKSAIPRITKYGSKFFKPLGWILGSVGHMDYYLTGSRYLNDLREIRSMINKHGYDPDLVCGFLYLSTWYSYECFLISYNIVSLASAIPTYGWGTLALKVAAVIVFDKFNDWVDKYEIKMMDYLRNKFKDPDDPEADSSDLKPIIDPSGFVYEAVLSNRVEGVEASVWQKETMYDIYEEPYEEIRLWDADPYRQMNPQITGEDGTFAWDVPDGLWQVRLSKPGYEDSASDWLVVPPPQTDVNIGIISFDAPFVRQMAVDESGARLVFSKYMDTASLAGAVSLTRNGEAVAAAMRFPDQEPDPNDEERLLAKTLILETAEPLALGTELELTVADAAESYAGVRMASAYHAADVVRSVETLNVSALTLEWNKPGRLVISAEPAALAVGRTIRVTGDLAVFGFEGESAELILNEFGRSSLMLTGTQSGTYRLRFALEGSSLETEAEITVLPEPVRMEAESLRLALGIGFGDTALLGTANVPDGEELLWTSADPEIVTVEDGVVYALSSGRTAVSVSAAGCTDTCVVEVLDGLSGLALPAALGTVEDEAFRNNDNAEYIILPNTIASVGDYAFADEDALLLVYIPSQTVEFGQNVFANSGDVIVVGFDGSSAQTYCEENEIAFQRVN